MRKAITEADVNRLVEVMKLHLPNFEIRQKSDSWFQRAIGVLLGVFNNGYMTRYATTMCGKVWFPSEAVDWSAATRYKLLRHEFIHLLDAFRFSIIFELSYLFLLPVALTMRSWWEFRAFSQSFIAFYEVDGDVTDSDLEWAERQFTSSLYLWMNPFKEVIKRRLWEAKMKVKAGQISGMYPYIYIVLPEIGKQDGV